MNINTTYTLKNIKFKKYKSKLVFTKFLININKLFFYKVYKGTNNLFLPNNLFMFEYIFKIKKNINIINLQKTIFLLKKSLILLSLLIDKNILFVENTKFKTNINIITNTAILCKKQVIYNNWLGGIISNSKYKKTTKIKNSIKNVPNIILLFNGSNSLIIKEAFLNNIPIICYTNTNVFSQYITYKVPWNDQSLYSLFLICKLIFLTFEKTKIENKRLLKEKLKKELQFKKNIKKK